MSSFRLTASITYPYDERVELLFEPESKSFERAEYILTRHADNIVFTIKATDATSLRAAMTAITKILSLWETTSKYGTE
jgi:tRNA threonylcarbamoyladenosine modification (KEOPS) complex  Pcc1 subunit